MRSTQSAEKLSTDDIKAVAGALSFLEAYYIEGSLEQKNVSLARRSLNDIEGGLFVSEESRDRLFDVFMKGVANMKERSFDLAYIYDEIRDAASIVRGAGTIS